MPIALYRHLAKPINKHRQNREDFLPDPESTLEFGVETPISLPGQESQNQILRSLK
jgi:hypothetical protein